MVQSFGFRSLACQHCGLYASATARRRFRWYVCYLYCGKCNEGYPCFRYFHRGVAKPGVGRKERKGRRILHACRLYPAGYGGNDECRQLPYVLPWLGNGICADGVRHRFRCLSQQFCRSSSQVYTYSNLLERCNALRYQLPLWSLRHDVL